jgi:hypothetical protein
MPLKTLGLQGFLSRMLIALFHQENISSGATGPPEEPMDVPVAVSLTNHAHMPKRHGLDLPGRERTVAPGHSLRNLLARGPAAHPSAVSAQSIRSSRKAESHANVTEIARFYLLFLSGIWERDADVRGGRLRIELSMALESARARLPERERGLLPDPADRLEPDEFLASFERGMASGEIEAPPAMRIRQVYLNALEEILTRLRGPLDDSVVKLLFRLGAKKALRRSRNIAEKYSLLEGIPDIYIRQVGPVPFQSGGIAHQDIAGGQAGGNP